MKEKKQEELQSRREFFKSAAKAALPVLGAAALVNVPIAKAYSQCNSGSVFVPVGFDFQTDRNGRCTNCTGTCYGNCQGSCQGSCQNSCQGNCQGDCYGTCRGHCGHMSQF